MAAIKPTKEAIMQKKLALQIDRFVDGFNESSLLLGLKTIIQTMHATAIIPHGKATRLALCEARATRKMPAATTSPMILITKMSLFESDFIIVRNGLVFAN